MSSQRRIMQQWTVGPVPDYLYNANSQNHPNELQYVQPQAPNNSNARNAHAYQQQQDLSRRNEHFNYPPNPQQPHHPGGPVQQQQPMPVPQPQPPQPQQQQQAVAPPPAPTPAPSRQRKRPAPQSQPQQQAPVPAPVPIPAPVPAAVAIQAPTQPAPASVPVQAPVAVTAAPAPAPPAAQPQAVSAAQAVDDATATPPTKKSRTNTPWTPAEELRLKQMRDAGNSWAEIARTFPSRTEGSVKKHWYKDMHYAEFAEDESQALLTAIKEYENNKWKVIGQKVGKPAKACEQYAKEHFPDLFSAPKAR